MHEQNKVIHWVYEETSIFLPAFLAYVKKICGYIPIYIFINMYVNIYTHIYCMYPKLLA